MKVYKTGSEVKFNQSDQTAVITAICIRSDKPTYEVVYWDGGRKCHWVEAFEIAPIGRTSQQSIGFI